MHDLDNEEREIKQVMYTSYKAEFNQDLRNSLSDMREGSPKKGRERAPSNENFGEQQMMEQYRSNQREN